MKRWASGRLGELKKEKLCGFVFKSGSPSSGLEGVKVFAPGGVATHRGSGIFARALMAALPLLPVADEEHLRDPEARRGFIKRVYVYHRWRELTQQRRSINRLVDFHQRHEYLIMAHSPERLRLLDELLAGQADEGAVNLYHSYGSLLMEALKFKSTVRKNNRVLQLSIRRLEPLLTSGEQKELRRTVGDYNRSVVPLVVPVTLISYFARKYDDRFLKGQLYINPGPAEMMLENHA
jgi:uncharacterized protein YbgA (DUF1722 family)